MILPLPGCWGWARFGVVGAPWGRCGGVRATEQTAHHTSESSMSCERPAPRGELRAVGVSHAPTAARALLSTGTGAKLTRKKHTVARAQIGVHTGADPHSIGRRGLPLARGSCVWTQMTAAAAPVQWAAQALGRLDGVHPPAEGALYSSHRLGVTAPCRTSRRKNSRPRDAATHPYGTVYKLGSLKNTFYSLFE